MLEVNFSIEILGKSWLCGGSLQLRLPCKSFSEEECRGETRPLA